MRVPLNYRNLRSDEREATPKKESGSSKKGKSIEVQKKGSQSVVLIKDDDSNIHNRWNNQLPPIVRVNEGDLVTFECRDGSDAQLDDTSTSEDVVKVNFDKVHPITGPVYVNGADPGDALEVEIVDIRPRYDYGWTSMLPGFGLIASDPFASVLDDPILQSPHFKVWRFKGDTAYLEGMGKKNISVPVRSFMGVMGVAPARRGIFRTLPPFEIGGNFDIRQLTKGSRVFFPVFNEGGLFSTGDAHAAQGDGEVCITAIEMAATFTCHFRVHKNWNLTKPRAIIPPQHSTLDDMGYYLTMGIDRDTNRAAREAVREMLDWISREHGLALNDAYVVASCSGDLKISEAVDMPNWTVSFTLPKAVFGSS